MIWVDILLWLSVVVFTSTLIYLIDRVNRMLRNIRLMRHEVEEAQKRVTMMNLDVSFLRDDFKEFDSKLSEVDRKIRDVSVNCWMTREDFDTACIQLRAYLSENNNKEA